MKYSEIFNAGLDDYMPKIPLAILPAVAECEELNNWIDSKVKLI